MDKLKNNNEAWIQRIRFSQQMLFAGIKQLGINSECETLRVLVTRQWFSGFDMTKKRLLPDGNLVKGAPFAADLSIRSTIIAEVLDGLKSRPRNGNPEPTALFRLRMYEYDLLLAMCQAYQASDTFATSDDINPYDASALETTINTMLHVCGEDEPEAVLYKPMDEDDDEACAL